MNTNTLGISREEWLEERKKGIGGSDASIVLGLNKWKSPFQLWLEKTNQIEDLTEESEAIHFGNVLEDVVAKEFERRTGKKVRKRNEIIKHQAFDFIFANIDRSVVGEKAILECKTTSAYNSKEWENDEIPESYIIQVQHYLGVLGPEYKKGYIAVLIGGNKFVWKEIDRDDDLINFIFDKEITFWQNFVIENKPPEIDGSSAAEEFLKKRYEWTEVGKAIDLESRFEGDIEQHSYLKSQKTIIDEQIKKIENNIKNELKDAEEGRVANYQIKWTPVISNRVDSKKLKAEFPEVYNKVLNESSSRRFSIKSNQ